jgi:subtilisin family serine protease
MKRNKRSLKQIAWSLVSAAFIFPQLSFAENHIVFPADAKAVQISSVRSYQTVASQCSSTKTAVRTVRGSVKRDLGIIGGVVASNLDAAGVQALRQAGYTVEVDSPVRMNRTPNDPLYPDSAPALTVINAPQAWDRTIGSSGIVVAVVDTGIDYNHPDLAPNMWVNPNEAMDGADNDGNGLVDDRYGYNFVYGTGDPYDDNNHGTHVAGTIGAAGNNGRGVAGINWNVKLAALKVLDAGGGGSSSGILAAIDYAMRLKNAGVNLRVINLSLEGGGSSVCAAITNAKAEGILSVAAAGNGGSDRIGDNNDAVPIYPSSCTDAIGVAAWNASGLAGFSNYGANSVSLAAPGTNIFSTTAANSYGDFSGTSMASPHVAGAAALIWSTNSALSVDQVRSLIETTVTPQGSLSGRVKTAGLLNVGAAVTSAPGGGTTTYRLTVRVVSLAGGARAPIAGATVTATGKASAVTNANGEVTFSGFTAGTVITVNATKSGFAFTPQTLPPINSDLAVELAGNPVDTTKYTLTGVVVSIDSEDQVVFVSGADVTAAGLGTVKTDANGEFSFGRVVNPGTTTTVSARKAGFSFPTATVTINADTDVELIGFPTALQSFTLSGRVLKDGLPAAGVLVRDDKLGTQTTGANGTFSFGLLPAGTAYSLRVVEADIPFTPATHSGTISDRDVFVEFRGTSPSSTYTITGQVFVPGKYNGGTSAWLGNVQVYIGGRSVYTNSKGRYTITGVPNGTKINLWFYKKSGNIVYRFRPNKFDVPNDIDVLKDGVVHVQFVRAYPVPATSSAAASIKAPEKEKKKAKKKKKRKARRR